MNIEDGTYRARPKAASVYESEKGSLVLAIVHALAGGGEIRSYHALTARDGTVMTRNIESLRSWSGWDGADPYWFMDTDLGGTEVELVIENRPGLSDPGRLYPSVKWVNKPGGPGGGGALPAATDRRAVLAKYGAMFRAVAGPQPAGAPARAAPKAAPAARPPATPPSTPPPPARRGGTQAGAWNRLNELMPGAARDEVERVWFACVDATGADQADMTPEGWAQVATEIERRCAAAGGAAPAEEEKLPF